MDRITSATGALHITNGDSAGDMLADLNLPGEVVAWRDVLHDGPVPATAARALAEVRAGFIANCGWGDYVDVLQDFTSRDEKLQRLDSSTEVVLWFEHDLYDQLQLCQVIARLAASGHARCCLINPGKHLTYHSLQELSLLYKNRSRLSAEQIADGSGAWLAFISPQPTGLQDLLEDKAAHLPFLKPALFRLIEEYPDAENGLARSQQQILECLCEDAMSTVTLFRKCSAMEEASYLGDSSFWRYLANLSTGKHPLIEPQLLPPSLKHQENPSASPFFRQTVALTAAGRLVLAGSENFIALNGINRWIGGVHLTASSCWVRRGSDLMEKSYS